VLFGFSATPAAIPPSCHAGVLLGSGYVLFLLLPYRDCRLISTPMGQKRQGRPHFKTAFWASSVHSSPLAMSIQPRGCRLLLLTVDLPEADFLRIIIFLLVNCP